MKERTSKFNIFLSIEKEEAWLERMSRQGYHLSKAPGLLYTFEKGEPQERVYKIDFRFFKNDEEMQEYLTLFEDCGWQAIDPRRNRGNFYFTALKQAEKDQHIFSDEISKAQRSYRYASYTFTTFMAVLLPYLVLLMNGTLQPSETGYLTPGLWEMQGFEFWRHFLFETPFVIMRVTAGYLPLVLLLIALFFVIRSYQQYKKLSQQR